MSIQLFYYLWSNLTSDQPGQTMTTGNVATVDYTRYPVEIAERVGGYEEIDTWYLDSWEPAFSP